MIITLLKQDSCISIIFAFYAESEANLKTCMLSNICLVENIVHCSSAVLTVLCPIFSFGYILVDHIVTECVAHHVLQTYKHDMYCGYKFTEGAVFHGHLAPLASVTFSMD